MCRTKSRSKDGAAPPAPIVLNMAKNRTMRNITVVLLIFVLASCDGASKGDQTKPAASEGPTKTKRNDPPMKDTTVTVDARLDRGKVTLTIPAGWTQDPRLKFNRPILDWSGPEKPETPLKIPRLGFGRDGKPADKSYEEYFKGRMEHDKKFAGDKYEATKDGYRLIDPANKMGRKLTPLAFGRIPGGWIWAYEVSYNPKTAGLMPPYFHINIWHYQDGDKTLLTYQASGEAQYKAKYYDKLLAIGKTLKIGK